MAVNGPFCPDAPLEAQYSLTLYSSRSIQGQVKTDITASASCQGLCFRQ